MCHLLDLIKTLLDHLNLMGPKRLKRITKLNHFHHQEIMIDCIFFAWLTNSEFSLQKYNGFPEILEFLSGQKHS